MSWVDYVRLMRFKNHLTFIAIVVIVLFLSDRISAGIVKSLALLYLSFTVLLYGGLYAINDVADIEADKLHPRKKKRPLPAGKISTSSALLFSFLLIALGLTSGLLLFGKTIFLLYLLFIFLNLAYSFFLKRIPYLELIGNTVTHPLRLVLAFTFMNKSPPFYLVLAYFFMILGFASLRRIIEKDVSGWASRSVLKFYSTHHLFYLQLLSFAAVVGIAFFDRASYGYLYLLMMLLYIILLFGAYVVPQIRHFWRSLFTA